MSIFQSYPPAHARLNLSFGIEQALITSLQALSEITDDQFVHAIKQAYSLVYPQGTIQQHLSDIITQVTKRFEESKQEAGGGSASSGKTLGSGYADWLSKLNAAESCLYLADFDTSKALEYYWKENIEVVQAAIKVKSELASQQIMASFEAAMYAQGGKYSNDTGGGNNVKVGSAEAAAELRKLGF